MKNIKFLILLITAGLFLLNSCEEGKDCMPDNYRATTAVLIFDEALSSPFINIADVNDYSLTFDVDVLFDDATFTKMDIMVVYSGDYTKQYLLQTITAVPSTVNVTGAEIIAAVDELATNADVSEGDLFKVFANITMTDGKVIPGMLWNGMGTLSADNKNLADILKGGVGLINIGVPCEYNAALTIGDYNCISEDWEVDGDVTITVDAVNPMKVWVHGIQVLRGLTETPEGCPMVINADYSITLLPVPFVLDAWGYTNMFFIGIGTFDTCDGTYEFAADINVDQGSFGINNFVLTRN